MKEELQCEPIKDVLLILGDKILEELQQDLPRFITTLNETVPINTRFTPSDTKAWWAKNGHLTGAWAAAARLFSLCQPSSAPAERGFSMMRHAVGEKQTHMLEDMREYRVRERYHIKPDQPDGE